SPELGITIAALALWVYDGTPGIETTLRAGRRLRSRSE
ncbi:metal-dependent hydrolase, partial [Halorubrum sp. GN11GM_10-3_MGM]